MQLVAMQRPHAPPVPPRPSRQIVAEALKRSARLPCPTRQAPPPPNVRPWRPDNNTNAAAKCRTVVYESVVEKTQQECSNRPERTVVGENQRESQRPSSGNDAIRSPASRKDVVTTQCAKVQSTNNLKQQELNAATEKLDDFPAEVIAEKVQDTKENPDDISSPPSMLNSTSEIKTTMLVTKSENNSSINESVSRGVASGASTSGDDCAIVVVIDKLERNITVNEDSNENIQHQDWLEAGIHYSSTKITLPGDDLVVDVNNKCTGQHRDLEFSRIHERIAMSSLQGLPPLPRSLSGFNLNEGRREACEPPPPPARSSSKAQKAGKTVQVSTSRPSPPGRQLTTLDTQLAILRKEMFGLRQLDLSLLSQLWSLNESIQEFRQLLQDQEDRAPSPSPSSEEGDDVSYVNHPPAPPRRPGSLHHHHHHHHHRPPRPARPLRPLPSDESPSSEEYGAV